MTDAKPIEPSTERVANTVAFLLRFSDDYEDLRTNGAETPLTEMLEKLTDDKKKELFLKAHETIAEMDKPIQEESFMTNLLEGIDVKEMAERAKKRAQETYNKAKLAAQGAAEEAKEIGSKKFQELKDFANSEEMAKRKEQAKEMAAKGSQMASQAASSAMSFLRGNSTKNTGGKRKNKTKKLTKKEKKMKRARK